MSIDKRIRGFKGVSCSFLDLALVELSSFKE
jgi:hypothetical protein